MSSIAFIRRKGDSQVYAEIQDDAGRSAWYQPVSPQALTALGLTDKNVRYADKVDNSLISGSALNQQGLQKLAQNIVSKGGNVGGIGPNDTLTKLAQGNVTPQDFGSYDTNFDPTTPEQEKQNAAVAAQMQGQYATQQALEQAAKQSQQNQNVSASSNKVSAAGLETPQGSTGQMVQVKVPGSGSDQSRILTVSADSPLVQAYGIYNPSAQGTPDTSTTSTTSDTSGSATSAGSTTSPGQAAPDTVKSWLINTIGMDPNVVNSLDPSALVWAGTAMTIQKQYADQNKQIASLLPSGTPQDVTKFMEQAKSEVDPEFAQQLAVDQANLTQQLSQSIPAWQQAEQQQAQGFQAQNEALAAQMAEQGLAQSGIRRKAEELQAQQQKGIVEASRRDIQNQLYGIGSQLEQKYGTANLNKFGLPTYQSVAYGGQPGAKIGYTPIGGITKGTQEGAQITAEQQRAAQLAQQAQVPTVAGLQQTYLKQ